jgi:ABC-type transporter Mla MlaB component
MSDPKDSPSFFRKVVKFVANPATDWADLGAPAPEEGEADIAKSELKAMIERKRRNDFVRKRELDMLRRVRREGLTSEQLASLGGSSRLDDSETRQNDSGIRPDSGVKAKIDEIEQQMVGENFISPLRRPPEFYNATTQPATMPHMPSAAAPLTPARDDASAPERLRAAASLAPSAATMGAGMSPLSPTVPGSLSGAFADPFAVEVSEVAHDPELDEAVIAFANADFDLCEQALSRLTGAGGERAQHAETWLVRFDLYRATGQQQKFETLALDYAQQFGWSAPQWYSLPKLVAESTGGEERPARSSIDGQVGWVCPPVLDADGVGQLSSLTLQMPLPWVFDWSALEHIDAEACARLSELFRYWIPQALDMRWLGGDRLFALLQETAPPGMRDADPAFWQLRLDALRMANRPDQFDEAAIDFCVTYEVSPPSWERAACQVRVSGSSPGNTTYPASQLTEVSTSFLESQIGEPLSPVLTGNVDLAGQLVGDIATTLAKMDRDLGSAGGVRVSCARLIRVDFMAAGSLLNWVLTQRNEGRSVSFIETHRLVALFFGAMGINEHARIAVRQV